MRWNEVAIIATTEAAEATANVLIEAGAAGTAIDDEMDYINLKDDGFGWVKEERPVPPKDHPVTISAYYPDNAAFPEILQKIKQGLEKVKVTGLDLGRAELVINDVREEDWETAWKQYYHPIRVTRFLTIVPYWEEYVPSDPEEKLLVMDPGMAFGTGTHATTRLSLEALETVMRGGERVLDVGTGSGVLSIAAKALGAAEVQAFDIDEVATSVAKNNLAFNAVAEDVIVRENNLLTGIKDAEADIIVANILAEILLLMVEDAWCNLKAGGYFILSGIIRSKRDELEEALLRTGFVLEQAKAMGDWHCLIMRKEVEEN